MIANALMSTEIVQKFPKKTFQNNSWLVDGYEHFESQRTIYSYFYFGLKNSSFRLPYQRPSSSADCARELLNGSKESASLADYTRKKFFWLGGADFL